MLIRSPRRSTRAPAFAEASQFGLQRRYAKAILGKRASESGEAGRSRRDCALLPELPTRNHDERLGLAR